MGTLGIKMSREVAIQTTRNLLRELYPIHADYDIDNIIIAGSIRRGKTDDIGDIDIILVTISGEINPDFSRYLETTLEFKLDASGSKLIRGTTINGIQFDFYSCSEDQLPFMLAYLTGPQDFNIGMRSQARKLGYKLNQFSISDAKSGRFITSIQSESQLFNLLGVNFIEPSNRTNWYKNYKEYKL